MDFTNKSVLITGGVRGIGKEIAMSFAEAGARATLSYHSNHAAAQSTLKELPNGNHHAIAGDIADPDFSKKLVEETIEVQGSLDILVNNAGIFDAHKIDEVDFEYWQNAWQRTLAVNLQAPANLSYHAANHMIKQGTGGRIVNVSSRGAFRGEPECPAYGASKAGLNAMSQSLAKKLAPHDIFVGVVAPGFVETDMAKEILSGELGEGIRSQSPLGRVAQPDEVAHAVLFLASEKARFCTGTIIDVNGASYLRS